LGDKGGANVKEWIIFLVGALGGSLVGSGATIYTYHHKLRDEKRNRDRDKKRESYSQYTQSVSTYFEELMLLVDARPVVYRLKSGTGDQADVEELWKVLTRAQSNLERLHKPTMNALNEVILFAPKSLGEAAAEVYEVCLRVVEHMNRGEDKEAEATQWDFNRLLHDFRVAARSDLDIRE